MSDITARPRGVTALRSSCESAGGSAGLDFGATRDLSALVIVYQDGAGVFHVKPFGIAAWDKFRQSMKK